MAHIRAFAGLKWCFGIIFLKELDVYPKNQISMDSASITFGTPSTPQTCLRVANSWSSCISPTVYFAVGHRALAGQTHGGKLLVQLYFPHSLFCCGSPGFGWPNSWGKSLFALGITFVARKTPCLCQKAPIPTPLYFMNVKISFERHNQIV